MGFAAFIPFAASMAASAFGGKKKGSGQPGYQTQQSGYGALPPEAQQAYQKFFAMLNNMQGPTMGMAPEYNPEDMFSSPEMGAYQQAMGNTPTRPIGVLEPLNGVQRSAISDYANEDFSEGGLGKYMLPFQQARDRAMTNINRNADTQLAGIRDRASRIGSLGRDPLYGGQLPQVEEARARAMLDAEAAFGEKALGLRSQSLADVLSGGNLIQKQNQAGLSAKYMHPMAFMQLLAGMPNSSTGYQRGATPYESSNLQKFGNIGLSMFGQGGGGQFGGMFG
jgi:hypothetical protein